MFNEIDGEPFEAYCDIHAWRKSTAKPAICKAISSAVGSCEDGFDTSSELGKEYAKENYE